MVFMGRSFLNIVDHSHTIEHLRHEAHRGSAKRARHERTTVGPILGIGTPIIGPNNGFNMVNLAGLFRPHYKLQRVTGILRVRSARARIKIGPSQILHAVVAFYGPIVSGLL